MRSAGFWKRSRSVFRRLCALPFIVLVRFYQRCISPFSPPSCRFTPTCSQYALEALRKYGPLKGGWLALRRLARCHPWGGAATTPCRDVAKKTAGARGRPGSRMKAAPPRPAAGFSPQRRGKPPEQKLRSGNDPNRRLFSIRYFNQSFQSHRSQQRAAADSNSSVAWGMPSPASRSLSRRFTSSSRARSSSTTCAVRAFSVVLIAQIWI